MSLFSIVCGIQMEIEVVELLSIYDVFKNYLKVDFYNKIVLYVQVVFFYCFVFFEVYYLQWGYKRDDCVRVVIVYLVNVIRWNSYLCEFIYLVSIVYGIVVFELKDLLYFIYFDKEIRSCKFRLFINVDLVMILWVYGKVQFCVRVFYKFIRNEIMVRDFVIFYIKEICQFLWFYVWIFEKGVKLFVVL